MKSAVSILLVVVAIASLLLAGTSHTGLQQLRIDHGLDAGKPLENAPPLVAMTTVVLGGFRGIIADVLWLRATYLQDRAKYFELVQLADWITKLEPRNTDVWAFHAWNMAYNVSVSMSDYGDRWRWVSHGIELLRDEGVIYNPGDPRLYAELGWIYQAKVGGSTDQAHQYYKRALAAEMTELFGGDRPDYEMLKGDPDRTRMMIDNFGLSPKIMMEVDTSYGPLDWRLPETHAIYWAHRGMKRGAGFGVVRCRRMVLQCLAISFLQGKLDFGENGTLYDRKPYTDLFETVFRTYKKLATPETDSGMHAGFANFLGDAVRVFNDRGDTGKARDIFEALIQRFPTFENANGFDAFIATRDSQQMGH